MKKLSIEKLKMVRKKDKRNMPKKINTTKYLEYILDETKKILTIDSPSGFTEKAANYVMN